MTTVTGSSRARTLLAAVLLCALCVTTASAQDQLPELTQRVNDFAGVIDARSRETIDALGSALQRASGDVIVVATVPTFKPYADIREYAVRLFANGGRGIGTRGMDNGLLILLAVDDRQVWIEVGYGLEPIITDGFAGETSRQAMAPEFRRGDYGAGLAAGVARLTERIAQARQVTLQGAPAAARRPAPVGTPGGVILALIVLVLVLNALGRAQRRSRLHSRWGGTSWSGWDSGVGPFRGGWGGGGFGGGGGGGFGGGFGGFGGGRSGGGGGGAGW